RRHQVRRLDRRPRTGRRRGRRDDRRRRDARGRRRGSAVVHRTILGGAPRQEARAEEEQGRARRDQRVGSAKAKISSTWLAPALTAGNFKALIWLVTQVATRALASVVLETTTSLAWPSFPIVSLKVRVPSTGWVPTPWIIPR